MNLQIFAVSDKGLIRKHNEDMVLIGSEIFRDGTRQVTIDLTEREKKFFVAIADGMGGHNAGEIASELLLRKIAEKVKSLRSNLPENELAEKFSLWASEIHSFIIEEGNKDPNRKGMGSTLIGVLFYDRKAYYINAGDSRLYRFRDGLLKQISRDHSFREILGKKDIPSNVIFNSFGGKSNGIFIDFEPVGGKILNGDILLLCSDGLSDMISDDEIEETLTEDKNSINKLLEKAKSNGGKDNISIILIKINILRSIE